ncbi:MAG: FHA domain-containing protein [Firmicutes bacterium]|nr:FHA domain-containing protein [Bacillota bacterium]
MAKLFIQDNAGVREFELVDAEVSLGRELDNGLRLGDPSVSRHHAVIRRTGMGFELEDLQSSNGVMVNGERVPAALLKDGDRVTLGQVQMTFVDPLPVEETGTVAIPVPEPINPLGTTRIDPSEVAKIQAMRAAPVEPPAPARPVVEPPVLVAPASSSEPASSVAEAPPAFLASYLPPVPDDAQPTGERGDFLSRLLAALIDGAVITVVSLIVSLIPFLGCIIGPLLGIGYTVFLFWCLIKFRATIGKKLMKLRVVPEADPSGNIDATQALLRWLGHAVNFCLLGLPYLMILGSDRKGLQDIFSNSIVIKVDR